MVGVVSTDQVEMEFSLPALPLHNDLLLTFSFRFQFLTWAFVVGVALPTNTNRHKPNFHFRSHVIRVLLGSLSICATTVLPTTTTTNVPYFPFFFISRRRQCVGFIKYTRNEQNQKFFDISTLPFHVKQCLRYRLVSL